MNNKELIEDLKATIKKLNNNINEVKNENEKLRKTIGEIQHYQRLEICEYFSSCGSISQTAYKYHFESDIECYWALVKYFGCSDPLQHAIDYEELDNELFGSDYDEEQERILENN
jgi:hypothetical protein